MLMLVAVFVGLCQSANTINAAELIELVRTLQRRGFVASI